MTNFPLHYFLVDLIGSCQDPPEIVSDNAKCRGFDNEDDEDDVMDDCSGNSSSRWESIPGKDNAVDGCLRRPSRELEEDATASATRSTPDKQYHQQDRRTRSMKQPVRTHSFDDITVLKDGMTGRRAGQRPLSESLQDRKAYLVPSSPTGTPRNVQNILNEAMVGLQLTASA